MAQLIQMRQQIRAIESIKKITHAMRLISMSSHSQLSHKAPFIENYKKELFNLFGIIQSANPEFQKSIINPESSTPRTLIVLVGSQKGLAGTFNSGLFRLFEKKITQQNYETAEFITIGKKASDFIKKRTKPIATYDVFNSQTLYKIALEIYEILINAKPQYTNVIFFSNYSKSFFVQSPEEYILIPAQKVETKNEQIDIEKYVWEQPVSEIFDALTKEYLHFTIQSLLFNSLLAEQSSRFQSMDSATKNAEDLLETLKLQYNKVRQTKITKEISELSTIR